MFTNAKTVMIGGKEVQSIIASNGGILYQKGNDYALSLVSDYYSIYIGDSVNLTATLTNNGVGVSGETIIFENLNSTPVLENVTATASVPDQNTYDIGDNWRLDADFNIESPSGYIDVYNTNTNSGYVRITYNNIKQGFVINPHGPDDEVLKGSVLYHINSMFYTDEGDMFDPYEYASQPKTPFSKIKFILRTTIHSVIPMGYGVTDSNGEATITYSPASAGTETITARYGDVTDSKTITINQFPLTLTSDKYSLNTNESATLTATLTNNNVPVSGEIINFCGIATDTPTPKNISANTETPVGCKYAFASIPTLNSGERVYLDKDHTVFLQPYGNGTGLAINGGSGYTSEISELTYENGKVYYTSPSEFGPRYDYHGSFNVGTADMSVILSDVPVIINDYGLSDTTDSNGEATVTYTPTTTGDKTITAKWEDLSDSVQIQVS